MCYSFEIIPFPLIKGDLTSAGPLEPAIPGDCVVFLCSLETSQTFSLVLVWKLLVLIFPLILHRCYDSHPSVRPSGARQERFVACRHHTELYTVWNMHHLSSNQCCLFSECCFSGWVQRHSNLSLECWTYGHWSKQCSIKALCNIWIFNCNEALLLIQTSSQKPSSAIPKIDGAVIWRSKRSCQIISSLHTQKLNP